jgi:hypothetical protein
MSAKKPGPQMSAVVRVPTGRQGWGDAVRVGASTLIQLRMLALKAQIAEHDPTIDEGEIVRRLVEKAALREADEG